MTSSINSYLNDILFALQLVDPEDIEAIVFRLFDAYVAGQTVFTCGNGASAALASHMACDLGKGTAMDLGRGPDAPAERRLRIHSLNDNTALLTAYSNDLEYQDIFVEQLKNLLEPGDVVVGISGSGGSPNVLRALSYARNHGAATIGFTGSQPSAGKMIELCDLYLQVSPQQMEQIEDVHVIAHHIVGLNLRAKIAEHNLVTPAAGSMRSARTAYIHAGD